MKENIWKVCKKLLTDDDVTLIRFGILFSVPIIIDGTPGPTGKTTLANDLREAFPGADISEMWEMEEGEKQHYKKSGKNTAYILITLNEEIKKQKNKTIVIDGITYTMERIPYTTKYVLKEEEKKSVRIREPFARRFKVIQLGG